MESTSSATALKPTSASAAAEGGARGGIQSTEQAAAAGSRAAAGVDANEDMPALLKEAQAQVDALYEIHEYYLTADKGEKQAMLRAAADKVLATLEAFGPGDSARERARAALLRGRALDAMDAFDPEAEAALTKAVKLEPSEVRGWEALAHCYWKKGDLAAARDCLLQGIARRPNKESLRTLSMVLRQLPPTTTSSSSPNQQQQQLQQEEEGGEGTVGADGSKGGQETTKGAGAAGAVGGRKRPLTLVEESVQRAKEAVMLDLTDPQSWYILGNAYVALFFSHSHAPADLERALRAYHKAEVHGGTANPDLFFNLAQVRSYREEFRLASVALQRAADLDPGLPVASHLRAIERRVARTVELLAKRGKLKERRLQQLAAALVQEEAAAAAKVEEGRTKGTKKGEEGEGEGGAQPAVARVTVGELREGPNPGALLALKLVLPLGQLEHPPSSFIVLDKTGQCVALSVYHLSAEAARRMDKADVTLHVLNPHLATVVGPVVWDGGEPSEASYKTIQILDPLTLLVDGQPIRPSLIAPAQVLMQAFEG